MLSKDLSVRFTLTPAAALRTALKSGEEHFLLPDKTAVIARSGARPYPQRT